MITFARSNTCGRSTRYGRRSGYGILLTCLTLTACAVGPNFSRPSPPSVNEYVPGGMPEATVLADGRAQRFASNLAVPAEWWRMFHAPTLDDTVAEALARNQTLEAANASLRQSEALLE